MPLPLASEYRAKVEQFRRKHRTALLVLLFTDIVGSTKLKHDLGDFRAITLIQNHHALIRQILSAFPDAEEIEAAGDSFFIVFVRPSDAVRFAVLLQSRLRLFAGSIGQPILDRIGIHVGEVVVDERADTSRPKDLYGIQVDMCARVMSLAEGAQILLSRAAFDNARPVLKGEDIEGIVGLSWMNHGLYLLKGVEEPMEICEVGETDKAVLKPPQDSEKVHRYLGPNAEPVLGWRPALGQAIPNTNWIVEEKLGEGGFGEVWLACHHKLKERRVFKFCFRADLVRALKREVTIFRLLKERFGEHSNIVAVRDVFFEQPPYYIVMDYVDGRDLRSWCTAQGGCEKIPLATRLEIIAQVADALQVAHDAGIIHRDVKPSNILISRAPRQKASFLAKLTDFGIGKIVTGEVMADLGGFTETMKSQAGTPMYMAPELLMGERFPKESTSYASTDTTFLRSVGSEATNRSDVYSLGLVLYQLIIGDFTRPLTMDWGRGVTDPLLREDLGRCFAGDPKERFGSAAELAKNLRDIENRRAIQVAEALRVEERKKRAYLLGLLRSTASGFLVVALLATLVYLIRDVQAGQYGSIEIKTFPSGAEVWLNGSRIGITPYQATRLRPGEFTYSLKRTNHEPVETKVTIAPKKQTSLLAMLETPKEALTNGVPVTGGVPHAKGEIQTPSDMMLVEKEGQVEVAGAGSTNWVRAEINLVLHPDDRLRTGPRSRATLRWKEQSVVRINELSEIKIVKGDSAKPVEFILPGIRAKIRG